MKRIKLLIILLLISTFAISQNTIWHYGKIGMRYDSGSGNDTLLIQFSGDSTYFLSNTNPIFKFSGGLLADSIKVDGGGWTKLFLGGSGTAGYIPYFSSSTILAASPLLLTGSDISSTGKIEATNMETNSTSLTTRLGIGSGANEDESASRNNTLLGYKAGMALTTQKNNTIVGSNAGASSAGSSNSIFGIAGNSISGDYNSLFGYGVAGSATSINNNSLFGAYSAYNLTTGDNNTLIGYHAGGGITTASGCIFLGYYAGYYETGSNKLYISSQIYGNEVEGRNKSLIYGVMDADPQNQSLTINGNVTTPYNLTVGQIIVSDKYKAFASLPIDSTIITTVTTTPTFLGAGDNNKFVNKYISGFSLDGDTIVFSQAAYDTRDSIPFDINYNGSSSTTNVNKTIYYAIQVKHAGEATYSIIDQTVQIARTASADTYYPGATCTSVPIYLYDGDKIQIVVWNLASTTTLSTKEFNIYLREQ